MSFAALCAPSRSKLSQYGTRTKIHATIGNLVVGDFANLIYQDDYHVILNFDVKNNTYILKLTSHACKIHFNKRTHLHRCSNFKGIEELLNFLCFEDFLGHRNDPKCSFDVIGRLVKNNNITVMDPEDKAKHLLEFKLQDLSGVMVPCTLWLYLTLKLHGFIKDNATSKEPIIVLILMAKQSMWNYVSQIPNCFAGTKVIINDEVNPHIKEFKKKIKVQVRVQDDSGTISLSMFHQDVCKLIGKTEAYIMVKIDKVDEPITSYPSDLDIMAHEDIGLEDASPVKGALAVEDV
ncbi:replication protein A 70 kDa DNA-binding subunit D [Tanacetum coccineum]